MSVVASLAALWMDAKEEERAAQEERRRIEDELCAALKVAKDLDGTQNHDDGQHRIKIVGRIDRKVDGDKVQELARESGLERHLADLFRWKPEINKVAWDSADASITKALSGAITAKPGRPSFTVTKKEEQSNGKA